MPINSALIPPQLLSGLFKAWRQLGALGFLFFWLLLASGAYLFAALDTSASEAYRSIDQLSRQQWYFGGIVRSLHRYAADAFVLLVVLHLIREWSLGRYRGFRRFSWLTGVPLLWFMYASGIGGFWLNWDKLGQFSAVATSEWLDWLPLFATPLTRNFLSAAAVSDRLFSLLVFIHIGVPLLLIFGLWFHVQRINHAAVFPSRALSVGTCAALLVLALAVPVLSQGEADLASVPETLNLDWFYLFLHPGMYATSPGALWLLVAGVTLILILLPCLPSADHAAPAAVVDPENCNGCRRCFDDCPYAAIVMVPHVGGGGQQLARVLVERCAACGVCVGSCPSATPFRNVETLRTGIDLPQKPLDPLRQTLELKIRVLKGSHKIVVFACEHGAKLSATSGNDIAYLSLTCIGMLPPSFVEYALHTGAAGVMVNGCRESSCAFRLGSNWTKERLMAQREPQLRSGVPRNRLYITWADRGEEAKLQTDLATFRRRIAEEIKHKDEQ